MRLICAVLRRLVAKLISLPKVGRRAISCRSPRPVVARAVFGEDICVPTKCRLQRPQGALDGLRRATGIVDGCRALHGLKSPPREDKKKTGRQGEPCEPVNFSQNRAFRIIGVERKIFCCAFSKETSLKFSGINSRNKSFFVKPIILAKTVFRHFSFG